MFILVHGNGLIPHRDLREFVQKKVESSFARFAHQIAKVDAHLADLNGPKRGVDKSIRLVIDIERKPVIVIEQRGEYWSALVESVVDRAAQTLARRNKKSRPRAARGSMACEVPAELLVELVPVGND